MSRLVELEENEEYVVTKIRDSYTNYINNIFAQHIIKLTNLINIFLFFTILIFFVENVMC